MKLSYANSANTRMLIGVFSDPEIHPFITCGHTFAVGTHLDVERLLCVPKMKSHGLDRSTFSSPSSIPALISNT